MDYLRQKIVMLPEFLKINWKSVKLDLPRKKWVKK